MEQQASEALGQRPGPLQPVHVGESWPTAFSASVFLAGSSPSFRQELFAQLAAALFECVVFVPEPREQPTGAGAVDAGRQDAWQSEALSFSDLLVLRLADSEASNPKLLSLWAEWSRTGRLIVCAPHADAVGRLPGQRLLFAETAADTAALILKFLRPGALRRAGERTVPLSLWRSPSFQSWYRALSRAGHFLEDVEVEWTHRSRGIGRPPFLWAMRPRVRVRGERRQLSGEVVIGRADVSVTILYHRPAGAAPLDTQVVLVREFRAAVRNRSGFAWMLPGGSAAQAGERRSDPRHTAVQEVSEETGLRLAPEQLQTVSAGDRQLVASLASYHAQVFRAELTDEQLAGLRATAAAGRALGATPSERCFVSVRRLGEIVADPDFDWSHLGMLMFALSDVLGSTAEATASLPPSERGR